MITRATISMPHICQGFLLNINFTIISTTIAAIKIGIKTITAIKLHPPDFSISKYPQAIATIENKAASTQGDILLNHLFIYRKNKSEAV